MQTSTYPSSKLKFSYGSKRNPMSSDERGRRTKDDGEKKSGDRERKSNPIMLILQKRIHHTNIPYAEPTTPYCSAVTVSTSISSQNLPESTRKLHFHLYPTCPNEPPIIKSLALTLSSNFSNQNILNCHKIFSYLNLALYSTFICSKVRVNYQKIYRPDFSTRKKGFIDGQRSKKRTRTNSRSSSRWFDFIETHRSSRGNKIIGKDNLATDIPPKSESYH